MRAKGMGARVIVTEINPLCALEATMDGFDVMPILDAASVGHIFVTVTGDINVIDAEHFGVMMDGAIVANSGHFNAELNINALEVMAASKRQIREFMEEYTLSNGGRRIYLLGEGRLVNLAAAEGHPAAVMDMSFANQALSAEYMIKECKNLQKNVYTIPEHMDMEIARLKLDSMGIKIDTLTQEQERYLVSWQEGT